MKSTQLSIEPLLELRQDITMPGRCERAGTRKPASEWRMQFPGLSQADWDIWFLDVTMTSTPINQKYQLVSELFKARGLYSMTYIQAAVDCIAAWEKQSQE